MKYQERGPDGARYDRRLHEASSEPVSAGSNGRDPRQAVEAWRTAVPGNDSNKEVVTALREIAAGIVKPDLSEVPDIDPLFVTRGSLDDAADAVAVTEATPSVEAVAPAAAPAAEKV